MKSNLSNTAIFVLLFLFALNLSAQNQEELDSLNKVLETEISDRERVDVWNGIARVYWSSDSVKTAEYANKAINLSEEIDYPEGISDAYYRIGWATMLKRNYTKATELYEEALKIAQEAKYLKGEVYAYNELGAIHFNQDPPKALEYYLKSLKINEEIGDKKRMATAYHNIGLIHKTQGDYPKALEYYLKSLKINEEVGDKRGVANAYTNIGVIHNNQGDYPKALEYYLKSLKINEEIGDKNGMSSTYNSIGIIFYEQKNYPKALEYYRKHLNANLLLNAKSNIAVAYNNIALVHQHLHQYDSAVLNYTKCIEIGKEINFQAVLGWAYNGMAIVNQEQQKYTSAQNWIEKAVKIRASIGQNKNLAQSYNTQAKNYVLTKQYRKALPVYQKSMILCEKLGNPLNIKDAAEGLSICYEELNQPKKSLDAYKLFKQMTDSLINQGNTKKLTQQSMQYDFDKEKAVTQAETEKQKLEQEQELQKQQYLTYLFIGGFIMLLAVALLIYKNNKTKQKANKLLAEQNNEIETQAEELQQNNEELNTTLDLVSIQKAEIEHSHKHITASINYAKRIQTAILPSEKLRAEILPEHFILFKPRDIVSGDFYWMQKMDNYLFVAVADCTGHGVPGAFMSMLGISYLNEIIRKKEINQANQVLNELRNRIKETLDQTGKKGESKDGMDIAFYVIDTNTNKLQFSGANNPLYIFRNKELIIYKANRQPIGIHIKEKPFSNHEIQLETGDSIYAFSDGYVDQFGGENGQKYLKKRFKETLTNIQDMNMKEQKQILEQELTNWQGKSKQIDDILVLGIKV
jgi:serine phosphatase RsbU (regulator of sigma subunit)/TPR repeat protein